MPQYEDMIGPCLQQLHHEFPDLRRIALETAARAAEDAIFDASLEYRAANHKGIRFHAQYNHYFGLATRSLGYEADEVTWQVRHRHPSGYRILVASGRPASGGGFEVSRKGEVSRELIRSNADLLGYAPSLFAGEEGVALGRRFLNHWLFVQAHRSGTISVYISIPIGISSSGTLVRSSEWEHMGDRDLSVAALNLDDAPEPTVVDFDIIIRDTSDQ